MDLAVTDAGVEHSAEIVAFVDAMVKPDSGSLDQARADVRACLGDAGFVDACATVASFNAVVKIADGSGIPLEETKASATESLRKDLSIDKFRAH